MDKIKSVIIDDEAKSRDLIRTYIEEFIPELEIRGEAQNVASGLKLITEKEPELVFLDINMPDGSGFDLLERLDSIDFSLVFISAYDQYAIKAFDYAALFYLLKPIKVEDLEKVVDRYKQRHRDPFIEQKLKLVGENKNEFKKIALPVGSSFEFVGISDIIRCEAMGSYTSFHTVDHKEIVVSKGLSNFEKILPQAFFFRVHKKHLINLTHVKKYVKGKAGYVIMRDDSHVDLSYRRKDEFVERLKADFGFI